MNIRNLGLFVFITGCLVTNLFSQSNPSVIKESKENVDFDLFKNRPDLGIGFDDVAKLKIFLRKEDYSFRDMMILDIAMLTSSDAAYYFPSLFTVEFKVKDKKGNTIGVYPFLISSSRFAPHLLKGGLESQSFNLIAGCQEEKYPIPDDLENQGDNKVIFENNLFMTLGDACIDFKKIGSYTITAEISNDLVLVSKNSEVIKTAVGRIGSNSLKIYVKR